MGPFPPTYLLATLAAKSFEGRNAPPVCGYSSSGETIRGPSRAVRLQIVCIQNTWRPPVPWLHSAKGRAAIGHFVRIASTLQLYVILLARPLSVDDVI